MLPHSLYLPGNISAHNFPALSSPSFAKPSLILHFTLPNNRKSSYLFRTHFSPRTGSSLVGNISKVGLPSVEITQHQLSSKLTNNHGSASLLEKALQQTTYSFTDFYKRPSTFYTYPSYLFLVVNHLLLPPQKAGNCSHMGPFQGPIYTLTVSLTFLQIASYSFSPHPKINAHLLCVCAHLYLLYRFLFPFQKLII